MRIYKFQHSLKEERIIDMANPGNAEGLVKNVRCTIYSGSLLFPVSNDQCPFSFMFHHRRGNWLKISSSFR